MRFYTFGWSVDDYCKSLGDCPWKDQVREAITDPDDVIVPGSLTATLNLKPSVHRYFEADDGVNGCLSIWGILCDSLIMEIENSLMDLNFLDVLDKKIRTWPGNSNTYLLCCDGEPEDPNIDCYIENLKQYPGHIFMKSGHVNSYIQFDEIHPLDAYKKMYDILNRARENGEWDEDPYSVINIITTKCDLFKEE